MLLELDNIGDIAAREQAIIKMNSIAAQNYAGGLHRTFYESAIGGFYNLVSGTPNHTPSQEACQAIAKSLNTFTLSRITDPTRQPVPLGLVFMNYVIPPTEAEYNSAALIRAIINNNKAFLLNRADPAAAPQVENNANSHFTNNSKNPLK